MKHMSLLWLAALMLATASARAQAPATERPWQWGAVLDATSTSHALELGQRSRGLQLGHSDLSASGPLGRHLQAQITAVVATDEGKLEQAVEEAWVQTRTLPAGLSVRAGRFAAQVGYQNELHNHALDFTERPLQYRAFLGGHWYDDGVRVNLTLPTSIYWTVGAEAFRGRQLVPEAAEPTRGTGAYTVSTKLGGDMDRSNSWQLGLAYLHSRRIAATHEEDESHDHGHGHGARFGGKHLWLADATWKWAPQGNNRNQQVRVTLEAARVSAINEYATSGQRHDALSLAAIWRFRPNWEVGARTDRLRVSMPHDDHFDDGRLREQSLMLAWKPSHMQTLRLQLARQGAAVGFDAPAKRSASLQYTLAFGAHGAHGY